MYLGVQYKIYIFYYVIYNDEIMYGDIGIDNMSYSHIFQYSITNKEFYSSGDILKMYT